MRAIEVCRTAVLGGHVEKMRPPAILPATPTTPAATATARSVRTPSAPGGSKPGRPNCCRSNISHVSVFTLPEQIAEIAFYNKETVYGILFRATSETLLTIARDPKHLGAEIGFFAILHTWGQNLLHHPHLHCVVPGGGLTPDHERWISCTPGFFLPVKALSRLFRRLFLEQLEDAFYKNELRFPGSIAPLQDAFAFDALMRSHEDREWSGLRQTAVPEEDRSRRWNIWAVTHHRVAISNGRLLSLQDDGQVTFQWKDYRSQHPGEKSKTMTLDADEFQRRFLIHTLPAGFQRYSGITVFWPTAIVRTNWNTAGNC